MLENQLIVELNSKGLDYAAVLLKRNDETDAWKLFFANFDGSYEFWPKTVEQVKATTHSEGE